MLVLTLLFIIPLFQAGSDELTTTELSAKTTPENTVSTETTTSSMSGEGFSENAWETSDSTPEAVRDVTEEAEGGDVESPEEMTTTPSHLETTQETTTESADTTAETTTPVETTTETTTSTAAETTKEETTFTTEESTTSFTEMSTSSATSSSASSTTSTESPDTEETEDIFTTPFEEDSGAGVPDCPEQCVTFVQGWKGDGDCDVRCFKCPQFWEADGEFDGGDCAGIQNPETGELELENYNEEDWQDYDMATEEPALDECPPVCTNEMIGDDHCDKVECKYCNGENGDPDFYNAKGVFDGNDCCDEICRQDWVGDGACDDDSSFWDFSCMHCDFFYDNNGVFDGGDCCASRCVTKDEQPGFDEAARPDDGSCDEICAQCPNFYDETGIFDGGDCGAGHPATGSGLPSTCTGDECFDFDTQTDEDWDNPMYNDDAYDTYDDAAEEFETCPQMCTDSGTRWIGDGECDYNMCKNCESFWKDGEFDDGDCQFELGEVAEKHAEINDFFDEERTNNQGMSPQNQVVNDLSSPGEETKLNVPLIGGVIAAALFCFCCAYCCWRRRSKHDFDDNGYGHSYDKGWNEMASFT